MKDRFAQIPQPIFTTLDGIVTQIGVGQTHIAEIVIIPEIAVIEGRIGGMAAQHLREIRALLFGRFGFGDLPVEPGNGEIVVFAQAVINQTHPLVFGLSQIVVAVQGRDRRTEPPFAGEGGRTQRIGRIGRSPGVVGSQAQYLRHATGRVDGQ